MDKEWESFRNSARIPLWGLYPGDVHLLQHLWEYAVRHGNMRTAGYIAGLIDKWDIEGVE